MTTKGKIGTKPEAAVSTILAIMYIFGVAYITFGDGAGTTIGNMYFSTMIGFVIAGSLASTCIREVMTEKSGESTEEAQQDADKDTEMKDADNGDKLDDVEIDEEQPEQAVAE